MPVTTQGGLGHERFFIRPVPQRSRGSWPAWTGFCLMMLLHTMVALDTRQATASATVGVDLSVDSLG